MSLKREKLSFAEKYEIITKDEIDLDNKIIYLTGELDEKLGTTLRIKYAGLKLYWEQERKEKLEVITLDISSFGGDVYSISAALDFYSDLKKYDNVLVNTRAQGSCMSAATVLVAGATGKRSATKRCKFMLHDIQTEVPSGTASQVKAYTKQLVIDQSELFTYYVEFSNKAFSSMSNTQIKREVKKWMRKFAANSLDHYLSSEEVLKLNLIDEIL